ncbi:MAG TPA: CHAT domain-containing protein [Longimicrobiaceae bacterium]|nr:CHAT domain-containing protein [Longimicrobiaceae bacterium]
MAAWRADRPGAVLADLAAAYLVRAERARTPRDLLAAIEAAEEALEREPRNPAALFNRALALQRFGLVEEAEFGWRSYLAVDSMSGWAGEAKRNLRELLTVDPPPPPPGPDAPESDYAAYSAADPQGARVLGWCRVLDRWAGATLAGNTARAEEHLRRAETLGRALERRPDGDASLADGVRAIRAQAGRHGAQQLAHAHQEFAAGCELEERVEFPAAAARYRAAIAAAADSPILQKWARLLYGSTLFRSGGARRGETILREVAEATDPVRHPALAGQARLLLASVLLREDRYESGLAEAWRAAGLFERSGERESEAATLYAHSVARFRLREMDEGYALAHRALERLRPYRSSYRMHNLLSSIAGIAVTDGFPRTAIRLQDEGVRVATRNGNPAYVAEARLLRARLLAAAGALPRAAEDVAVGQEAISRLADRRAREWMVARQQMAEAVTSLRADPARAAAALDSAAAYFQRMHAPLVALPAVVDGAQAWLAAGDTERGTARLEAALAILEQRRDSIRMEPRRAAVFEAARAVVDRVAMLKLAAGDTAEALNYLDRGRASLAPVGRPDRADSARPVAGPPGEVGLEYALVGDTLLVWTVAGRRVEVFRIVVDTVRLARTVERLRQQLEGAAGEAELRPGLTRLYDWLLRPVEDHLGREGVPLVIVADGDLASVPFAALYNARQGRYLVEDRPLRFAASLREAWRRPDRTGAAKPALFVSDPAFDPEEHPGFERLKGAADEVREVAAGYPRQRLLSGAGASREAFREALAGAGLVHYAGHAVFDDERPERSYLLLAPTPGWTAPPTLAAAEIAQMDLRHLSLVVLAACQTVRTGPGRAAGFSGLAGAFLAAGAGGAVGSLWDVDDRLTRALMVEFHRAYRSSGNGPMALRAAQRHVLRSGDEALRSPAAWAGFQYVGN